MICTTCLIETLIESTCSHIVYFAPYCRAYTTVFKLVTFFDRSTDWLTYIDSWMNEWMMDEGSRRWIYIVWSLPDEVKAFNHSIFLPKLLYQYHRHCFSCRIFLQKPVQYCSFMNGLLGCSEIVSEFQPT